MPTKISQLPAGTALGGTEVVPAVQSGSTVKSTISQIGTFVRGLFTTTPATLAEGGTGAATAAAARTSLGATATGSSLFTTASAAAARTTLGSTTVGDAVFIAATAKAGRTALSAMTPATDGQFDNLGLSVTMSANAVTVALKGADGNDPSASNPVTIAFRSATVTSGASSAVSVTAATSVVIPSGATLGTNSAIYSRVWILALLNAGAVELAVVNCVQDDGANTRSVHPLSNSGTGTASYLMNSSAIGTGSDSAAIKYSTAARTAVPYVVLGCFDSKQATAGTWASSPDCLYVNPSFRPGDLVRSLGFLDATMNTGAGVVIPDDDTLPQTAEGSTWLTLTTDQCKASAPNLHEITAEMNYSSSAAVVVTLALFESGGSAIAATQSKPVAINTSTQMSLKHRRVCNNASGQSVYTANIGPASAATMTINGVSGARKLGGAMEISMTVNEISA